MSIEPRKVCRAHASFEDNCDACFYYDEAKQLRAERDTLSRRVAELEVLVKCPREEDHLRIDALTAENGRLLKLLRRFDDNRKIDCPCCGQFIEHSPGCPVDAALASGEPADTKPVAGVEGLTNSDSNPGAPSEAAEPEWSWEEHGVGWALYQGRSATAHGMNRLSASNKDAFDHQGEQVRWRIADLLNRYGLSDTARITKEPSRE
jgi:hypothetical protein